MNWFTEIFSLPGKWKGQEVEAVEFSHLSGGSIIKASRHAGRAFRILSILEQDKKTGQLDGNTKQSLQRELDSRIKALTSMGIEVPSSLEGWEILYHNLLKQEAQ